MAEGIEAYHVPQQSRRDKLRVVAPATQNHHSSAPCTLDRTTPNLLGCAGLLPMYDPSLISPEMLACTPHHHHQQAHPLAAPPQAAVNMAPGFGGRYQFHPYFDPQSALPPINPTSLPDIDQNPLLFSTQNHCYSSVNGTEVVAFKPEPLSLSLSSQPYLGIAAGSGSGSAASNNVMSKALVPLGPFTGYASILKGSRFLKPAQQLLEEVCDVVGVQEIAAEKAAVDSTLIDPPSESLSESGIVDDPLSSGDVGEGTRGNKSRLVSMLDEVYRRYKQYYQQIQEVMTSFEYISGLGNAAPFANLAIKAMYKHFKCLKNAILDQLQFTKKAHGDYSQRSVHSSGFLDHQPVWRPQRGLPERAVSVLRAWLFEHFLHPYPSDTDKLMLAKQTGLSRSQVSNWFINARVRLWKPMVEEIYMLETKQTQKNLQREERNAIRSNDHHPSSNSLASDDPSTSAHQLQDTPPKRNRNEPHDIPLGNQEPLNVSYNLSSNPHMGANANIAANNGGVSLTLGLHQNNGVHFSEPFPVGFPVTATRRFGLGVEANNNGYVMGGFEAQNRHFGRDVIGGQLLHDFVG